VRSSRDGQSSYMVPLNSVAARKRVSMGIVRDLLVGGNVDHGGQRQRNARRSLSSPSLSSLSSSFYLGRPALVSTRTDAA
jgi:hypothetical protein